MLKIYGNKMSSSSTKVEYVAQILKLPYEWKQLEFAELKTPEHLKRHPAGKIPAIDDDGFILFESTAICRYLCEKHNNGLYPRDLKTRALTDQWMDFVTLHVGSGMEKVAYNRVFAPMLKMEVDERSLQDGLKFLDRFLPIIDTQLTKHPYLAGEKMTLADINLLSVLTMAEPSKVDLSKYHALTKWRVALMLKDFYVNTHGKK